MAKMLYYANREGSLHRKRAHQPSKTGTSKTGTLKTGTSKTGTSKSGELNKFSGTIQNQLNHGFSHFCLNLTFSSSLWSAVFDVPVFDVPVFDVNSSFHANDYSNATGLEYYFLDWQLLDNPSSRPLVARFLLPRLSLFLE